MALSLDSKKFTVTEMWDGTAETWLQALSISTIYDVCTQQLGSATSLLTVVYDSV